MTHAAPRIAPHAAEAVHGPAARIQTRLMLGPAEGLHEQEADRIAEAVLADRPAPLTGPLPVMPLVQRQTEEEDEQGEVQAKAAPARHAAAPAPRGAALSEAAVAVATGGRPLSRAERNFFEPRFGRDFSAVRLHDGPRAAAAARGIGARAYTVGQNIAFAPGQHDPFSPEGRNLMAHELTHTLQQGTGTIRREEGEAEEPDPPPIEFNFDPTKAIPSEGGTTGLVASYPLSPVTWSITDGTATVAAGTTIDQQGRITLAADQVSGSLTVNAVHGTNQVFRTFSLASVPTGIESTAYASDLNNADTHYGAAFQHTFTSPQGSQNVLENLRVGERFPGVPSPAAATHRITGGAWPFGRGADYFDLDTGTLNNNGSGGWALDASGQFGPPPEDSTLARGDNVSTPMTRVKLGDHVQSASNPSPRNRLPVTLTLDQEFHYFSPRAPSGRRWTRFTTTAHSRTLRRNGSDVQFVTTVNGVEHEQDYAGPPAVTNLTASPVNTPKSPAPPPPAQGAGGTATPAPAEGGTPAPAAPPARTVALSVETLPGTLPSGASLDWSFVGNALGCTLTPDPDNPNRATLTIGTTAGTVTVQVAEATGTNFDRVPVRIT